MVDFIATPANACLLIPPTAIMQVLDDLTDRLPELYDMEEIRGRIDEYTPYVMVAVQESERMNVLLAEMRRSLAELDLGLKGDLTMSEPMERLMHALATDMVPASWRNLAYPSLRPLGSWLQNLLGRCQQLTDWTADMGVPKVGGWLGELHWGWGACACPPQTSHLLACWNFVPCMQFYF
jgi:dynein heavy chain